MVEGFNPFAGMKDAKTYSRGVFIEREGVFVGEVNKIVYKDFREGGSGLILEWTVLESSCPDYPVGTRATWIQKKNDSFLGSVKGFLAGVLGKTVAEVADDCEAFMLMALDKEDSKGVGDNALDGMKFRLNTRSKTTVKKGLPFTEHSFFAYQDPAAAA